jgi:Zn-finger nucleic acid-binding protein
LPGQLGSVRFEGCRACKGVWLFPSELRRLKDKVGDGALRWMNDEIEAIGQAAAMETKRVCPHCPEQRLTAVRFGRSTVMMDWCPQCRGVWLDQDEFSVVYDFLRQESEAMKPGDIEKELLAEIQRPDGDESRVDEIRALRSGLLAMLNATVIEHPALGRLCANIPRVFL